MELMSALIINTFLSFTVCVLGAYLLGAIPFGLLLTKMAGMGDIRQIGSGNIGATNVLRTGRKWLAFLTLFLDLLKGVAAVEVARQAYHYLWQGLDINQQISLMLYAYMPLVAAVFAVVGHIFSLFVNFKGGKGVATAVGVFIGLWPVLGFTLMLGWVLIAIVFRYSSFAAVVAMVSAPIIAYIYWPPSIMYQSLLPYPYIFGITVISVLVLFRHKENILRLVKGQEPKITFKK